MPDCFIIFIILLALVMVNIIGWAIRDIIKLNKDNNETERWLAEGERHASGT